MPANNLDRAASPGVHVLVATDARSMLIAALACAVASLATPLYGQAGLRESLERLDRNGDGEISPDEITPLARPYLERITRARDMSLERSNDVERLLDAARIYYAVRNGVSGRNVRANPKETVRSFTPTEDQVLLPEFGLAKVKYPYTQADVDQANRTLRRYDRNQDGYIDRAEAAISRWTHRNPFLDDLNDDDRLSRQELTQRYARRRFLDNTSGEVFQQARRTGNGVRAGAPRYGNDGDRREGRSSDWRTERTSQYWLALGILSRFDWNRDGRIDRKEADELALPFEQVDQDADGLMTRDELAAHLFTLRAPDNDQSQRLPGWFFELDENNDDQVSMNEFTDQWTAEKMQEFESIDANGDGLLTKSEVANMKQALSVYSSNTAQALAPGRTIISEIMVSDDYLIDDLDVRLSITHTSTGLLDAYLTGPDGQRIELFTEVGGSGDHFNDTIFDDQSRISIARARAPFEGAYIPEALGKEQPSLSHFTGKSVRGVWQLVLRGARSDRFGMLHKWELLIKPKDGPPAEKSPASAGPESSESGKEATRDQDPPTPKRPEVPN